MKPMLVKMCFSIHTPPPKKWKSNKIIDFMNTVCVIDACANVDCNRGRCETLSETETLCNCDAGWYGEFCDISEY